MRSAFIVCVLAACLLAPSVAAADDYDAYVGVELGRTTLTPSPYGLGLFNDLGLIIPDDPALKITRSSSLSSTSHNVEAGVWLNSYVGLQIGYLDMGTFSESTRFQDPHSNICFADCSLYSTSDFTEINKVSVAGLVLAVTGRVPLPYGFELLGRFGMFEGDIKYEEDTPGLAPGQLSGSDTMSGSDEDFGVGLGWRFSRHWGVELWRDRFTKMGNTFAGNTMREDQFDVKGYSLGVQYHF